MANTFVKIATVTVGAGGAATMTFSSIPSTYTDLCLLASLRSDKPSYGFSNYNLSINGSTSTFTSRYLEGSGASATSGSFTTGASGNINGPASTASTFSNTQFYFPNYTSSAYKSYSLDHVTEANATTAWMDFIAGLWSTTSAITSLTLTEGNSSVFAQYSTATLYGISKS
jgi:hypothetical protein